MEGSDGTAAATMNSDSNTSCSSTPPTDLATPTPSHRRSNSPTGSLLLDLPAELRLLIFEHIYAGLELECGIVVSDTEQKVLFVDKLQARPTVSGERSASCRADVPIFDISHALALPLTCKLFTREALPLLYDATFFCITIQPINNNFSGEGFKLIHQRVLSHVKTWELNVHLGIIRLAFIEAQLNVLQPLVATLRDYGAKTPRVICFTRNKSGSRHEPGAADALLCALLPRDVKLPQPIAHHLISPLVSRTAVGVFKQHGGRRLLNHANGRLIPPRSVYKFAMSDDAWRR